MTPENAPYKVAQRVAKASKYRAYPLWVSCEIINIGRPLRPLLKKVQVQGTFRREKPKSPKGKANVKAAKRSTNRKCHYWQKRFDAMCAIDTQRIADICSAYGIKI